MSPLLLPWEKKVRVSAKRRLAELKRPVQKKKKEKSRKRKKEKLKPLMRMVSKLLPKYFSIEALNGYRLEASTLELLLTMELLSGRK